MRCAGSAELALSKFTVGRGRTRLGFLVVQLLAAWQRLKDAALASRLAIRTQVVLIEALNSEAQIWAVAFRLATGPVLDIGFGDIRGATVNTNEGLTGRKCLCAHSISWCW